MDLGGMRHLTFSRVWFFERSSVPDVFNNNETTVDTLLLGTPMGNWPSGGCNMEQYFSPQTLVFDITLCGGECVCHLCVCVCDNHI